MRPGALSNAGIAVGVVSGATFGTSGSFASSLIRAGWSPGAAVTARVVVAAALLTIPALWQLRAHRPSQRASMTILLYGVIAVAGAQLCYFNAVAHLSVAVALLLEYSGILLVIAWSWARDGQQPTRLAMVGSAVALGGLVLVLDLAGAHRVDAVGVLWGLGAAIGLAVYFVIASGTEDAPAPLVVAWGGLAVGAVLLGLAATAGVLQVDAPRTDVTLLDRQVSWVVPVLGMAVVAGVVAYLTGIAAARMLGARLASFVGLTEVLFAVLFAWLLLGQRLDPVQLAGGVLVVGGIALVRLDAVRAPKPSEPAALRSERSPQPAASRA